MVFVKIVGAVFGALVALMIVGLLLLGACAQAPARASRALSAQSAQEVSYQGAQSCLWNRDEAQKRETVGCGFAMILPLAGPVVGSCALAREFQGKILGVSCMLFRGAAEPVGLVAFAR